MVLVVALFKLALALVLVEVAHSAHATHPKQGPAGRPFATGVVQWSSQIAVWSASPRCQRADMMAMCKVVAVLQLEMVI